MPAYREMLAIDRENAKALAALSRDGVTVERLDAGKAAGLGRDIGVEGKRRCRRDVRCYGNGERLSSTFADYWSRDLSCQVMVRA